MKKIKNKTIEILKGDKIWHIQKKYGKITPIQQHQ